jgi:hypothetical protein
MGMVKVTRGRDVIEVPEQNLEQAKARGYEQVSSQEAKRIKDVTYAAGAVGGAQGAAEAALSGATLGGSDVLLRSMGVDTEGMAARREGVGSKAFEVAGAIAPALLTGGAGAAGTLARLSPAGLTARLGRGVQAGVRGLAGEGALARVAGSAAAGAAEGFVGGVGQAASEAALGDRDLAAEQLLAGGVKNAGLGALFGAGSTTLGIGLEKAYTGGQRVSRDLLGKALGAGDDATTAAGRAALTGDNVITGLAERQVKMLGGGAEHVEAARRALDRTRTASGRKMATLAGGPAKAVDAAVGERLRKTLGGAGAGKAVKSWGGKLKASEAGKTMLAKRATQGAESLRGVQGKGAAKVRQLLRAQGRGIKDLKSYTHGRGRVTKALKAMEDAGDPALEQARSAAQEFLGAAKDELVWGKGIQAADAVRGAQALEKEILGKLRPKARAALTGGEIDDATAAALAKNPAVGQVLDARAKVADALEAVGEDVGRRGGRGRR